MCQYIYQINRECGHRTIKLDQPCRSVYFGAGLTPGLLAACPEMLYESQLGIMVTGKKLDEKSDWSVWEGWCQYCIRKGLAPKDHKTETLTTEKVPLYSFLPLHKDYKLWFHAFEKELKIRGLAQSSIITTRDFLTTIPHPFMATKLEIISLPKLLGVEDQVSGTYHLDEHVPMIIFNLNIRKWNPQESNAIRWVFDCFVKIGTEWLNDVTQTKNWALVRNWGQTYTDHEFVNAAMMAGINWETVYQFESRGMLKSAFQASLLRPYYPDGPNPVDDLMKAFEWNDLFCAAPEYQHLMIPIPPANEMERMLELYNSCAKMPEQEKLQNSMLMYPGKAAKLAGEARNKDVRGVKRKCETDQPIVLSV